MRIKRILCILMMLIISININYDVAKADNLALQQGMQNKIEDYMDDQINRGKIPGMTAIIIQGDKIIYERDYGFSDVEKNERVTTDTLFELGSTSKAFTAFAVYLLEERGLISTDDLVSEYIPWFNVNYKQKSVDITIEQLLHHTSGIPYSTISDIPVLSEDNSIEKTVKNLVDVELDYYPGQDYTYATINYDVLGLIIETVSGKDFETFMVSDIFRPLGLTNTSLDREKAQSNGLATGYKRGYGRNLAYDAPEYRGNAPAGYIITNKTDIARWTMIQLGAIQVGPIYKRALDKTHIPNRTVPPNTNGSSYAGGWSVYQDGGGEISHAGNNPNYSSYIVFRQEENLAVAIMANSNSAFTVSIGKGIMDILMEKTPYKSTKDEMMKADFLALALIVGLIPFIILCIWNIIQILYQAITKKRTYNNKLFINIIKFTVSIGLVTFCIYTMPSILFDGVKWPFLFVWSPESIRVALIVVYISCILFLLYFHLNSLFVNKDNKSFFTVITVSVLSGFGNAFIIFIINLGISRFNPDKGVIDFGLVFYFFMGIVVYVFGQRIVRLRLISVTNNIAYNKRMTLISRIIRTSYEQMEPLDKGDLIACLNNDTEEISSFANIIVTAVSNTATLLCCFVYLGIISIWGLLVTIVMASLALVAYYSVGTSAEKLWERVRDNQSLFIKYINDLIYGFKELSLNNKRANEFQDDIMSSCKTYRDKNIEGSFKFANVFVIGELVFTMVIGSVVFLFPVIFKEIEGATLFQYVFVFLYMTGPIHGILGAIPDVMHTKISWNRIKELEKKLSKLEVKDTNNQLSSGDKVDIVLKDIEYSYKNNPNTNFKVGPVNCTFKSGEVTFITGGNGSGKSTLAKLVTGLYGADNGEIIVNDRKVKADELGEYYSAIFSDYYLFDCLYGVDIEEKINEIESMIKSLGLEDKLNIVDNKFSTINLSSGQRKRIALLISYLEDRPVYLFDEWAADQDPEFRKIFYTKLLPELKDMGKTVIAITHDDGYFDTADKVIKLDMGRVFEEVAYDKN